MMDLRMDERSQVRTVVMVGLVAAVVFAAFYFRPSSGSRPQELVPQGGARSLRAIESPTEQVVSGPIVSPEAVAQFEEDPGPVPISLDPATFRPPFEDSVVLEDVERICDTPPPDNAIYVALDGNDRNPGTADQPLATISRGVAMAEAGQTVLVRGGDYRQSVQFKAKFGTPDAYITLRAYPGEKVKLIVDRGLDGVSFRRGNAYINVACFEMAGPTQQSDAIPPSPDYHRNRTLAGQGGARDTPNNYGHGVSIGDRADTRAGHPVNHHIRIIANDIHDFSAGGISALESNHISAIGNRTYRNAKYSCYSASGIAFGYMLDGGGPDNEDGYSNYIIGNVSYENENISLQCFTDNLGAIITDGNGIIIDDNDSQGDKFTARTLIADNVSYNNGGRGIIVFNSSKVDVINNATYRNAFTENLMGRNDPSPEIGVADAEDVNVYNNITFPSQGNLAFQNKRSSSSVETNIFGEPGDEGQFFNAPAIDGSGDFSLKETAATALEGGTPYLATPVVDGPPIMIEPAPIGPLYNNGRVLLEG